MHSDKGRGGNDLTSHVVLHLMKEAERLILHVNYSRTNADRVPVDQFALEFRVLLHRCHSHSLLAKARRGETEVRQQLPAGFIKFGGVPHHIHVPHVVALPRIDSAPICINELAHFSATSRPSFITAKRPSPTAL